MMSKLPYLDHRPVDQNAEVESFARVELRGVARADPSMARVRLGEVRRA